MQHIPDNEIDRLFKEGLADAEVQPSVSLWGQIESQIAPKKKYKYPYLWIAAATVVVALSAGLIFNQAADLPVESNNIANVAGNKSDGARIDDNVDAPADEVSAKADPSQLVSVPKTSARVDTHQSDPVEIQKAEQKNNLIAMQPVPAKVHHINTTPVQELEQPMTQVMEMPAPDVAIAYAEPPVAEAINEATESEEPVKIRIRNAGDLVNFVVNKIDKRAQKLVEFRTDEDDNSSLVAVNIGPFKINQRKNK